MDEMWDREEGWWLRGLAEARRAAHPACLFLLGDVLKSEMGGFLVHRSCLAPVQCLVIERSRADTMSRGRRKASTCPNCPRSRQFAAASPP